MIDRYSVFYGFSGNPLILSPALLFDPVSFATPVLIEVNHTNLELETSFFFEHQFNKFGLSASAGLGIGYFLTFDTKMTDLEKSHPTYGEEIEIEGDFKPKDIIPFAAVQIGAFYEISEKARIFLQPSFRRDFTRTKSE